MAMTDKDRLINLIDGFVFGTQIAVNSVEWDSTKVKELADHLLSNGVIVPPCKVGEFVYAFWSIPTKEKYVVYCAEVKKISQYYKNCRLTVVFEIEPIEYRGRKMKYQIDDFGKAVFLTKEEAEAKLKEREGNG